MGVWLRARSELRGRARTWIALALLAGLVGGVTMAAAGGARRTSTAFDRGEKMIRPVHLIVGSGPEIGFAELDLDRVARLPQVAVAAHEDYPLFGFARTPSGRKLSGEELGFSVSPDRRYGSEFQRPEIVDGRRADPARAKEVIVGETTAERFGLGPGTAVDFAFFRSGQRGQIFSEKPPAPRGPRLRMRVVGVFEEFVVPGGGEADSPMLATAAFHERYADTIPMIESLAVRLKRGEADLRAFTKEVGGLATGGEESVFPEFETLDQLDRSARFVAAALWLIAGLAALAGVVILAQALVRQAAIEKGDHGTLRAIGMTPRQLLAAGMVQACVVAAAAALVAAALAVVLSPLAPLGLARDAEPDPGLAFDGLVVGAGAVTLFTVILALAALASRRAARGQTARDRARGHRPGAAGRLARLGLPVTVVTGARFALERGRGRDEVPVGSALVGVTLAVAMLTAALVFTASLDRLDRTPRLYGQNWDVQAGDGSLGAEAARQVYPALRREPAVSEFSGGTIKSLGLEGRDVQVLGFERAKGSVTPTVIDGRAPARADEVLLAAKTIDLLGKDVGDSVQARAGHRMARFGVVGKGVLPELGLIKLGGGAAVTLDGLRRLIPKAPRNAFMIRFRPGTDIDAAKRRLGEVFEERDAGSLKPRDVTDFSDVGETPYAMSALIGLLALMTLAHVLATTARRRARDIAILRVLGLKPGQVARTLASQASTYAAFAVVVGIPLGLAAGSWGWRLFAEELGVVPEPVVPALAVLLIAPGALVVANLLAALPTWIASGLRPAEVLRAE